MDPNLYLEVLRKQAQVWEDLFTALEDSWDRWVRRQWAPDSLISVDEVLADLAYGRD
jgi:hypothetical protein